MYPHRVISLIKYPLSSSLKEESNVQSSRISLPFKCFVETIYFFGPNSLSRPRHGAPYLSPQVCRHWLRGLCMMGDRCDFLHKMDRNRMPICRCVNTNQYTSSLGQPTNTVSVCPCWKMLPFDELVKSHGRTPPPLFRLSDMAYMFDKLLYTERFHHNRL